MQWLIDSIKKLCNDYTDQAILDAKVIPSGTIILWSNTYATIPDGWTACDGTHGTPDLRTLFVRGSGFGGIPGDTGGAETHNHGAGGGLTIGKDRTSSANHLPPYHVLWYIMKL